MDMLIVRSMDSLKESHEIRQMAEGDVSAFNLLYERYHKNVHRNILKLVKSPELATELLQDVFLSLWQNRFKFSGKDTVGGWLFMVSYNKSLNTLRKRLKEQIQYVAEYPIEPLEDNLEFMQEEDHYNKQLHMLEEAVNILPARKKQVFVLCRYEGHSKEDVAAMLGISTQSVSDYLKQSNKTIRAYVRQKYPTYVSCMFFLLNVLNG